MATIVATARPRVEGEGGRGKETTWRRLGREGMGMRKGRRVKEKERFREEEK